MGGVRWGGGVLGGMKSCIMGVGWVRDTVGWGVSVVGCEDFSNDLKVVGVG